MSILTYHLQQVVGQSNYSAEFDITITNDSVHNFTYSTPVYQHSIIRELDGSSIDPSYLHYQITGISTGDIISAKTSVTFRVTISFTNPLSDEQYDTFLIDGEFSPTVTENKNARLYADVNHNQAGDLRGSNTSTAYTIKIMNTYDVPKTFTMSIDSNKFDLKDSNMSTPVQYTVGANENEATFTFYLVKKSGTEHLTDTERVGVIINTDGQEATYAGRVTVLVDQNSYYNDENAPLISNVVAEYTNTTETIRVSWSGRDIETYVVKYTIIVYRNRMEADRIEVNGNTTSYEIPNLSDGEFYFVVIGEDPAGNTATSSEISQATQQEGHASSSAISNYYWLYSISFNLTGCKTKANENIYKFTDYSTTIQPKDGYAITNYSITVGGNTMSTSGYLFNTSNNSLTIYGNYITGNIVVTVTATRQSGGVCG